MRPHPIVAVLLAAALLGPACRSTPRPPPVARRDATAAADPAREAANRSLVTALREADVGAALRLLEAGADPDARAEAGETTMILAATIGDVSLIDAMLDRGARINEADAAGQTPLTAAVVGKNLEAARRLLARGAEVNPPGIPITPLMLASGSGGDDQLPLVELLLQAGADVDARDHSRRTALMYAAGKIRPATVERLVAAGADVNARDQEGRSVLFFLSGPSERAARDPIVAFLREQGAVE